MRGKKQLYCHKKLAPRLIADRAYLLHEIEFHSATVNAVKQTLLPTIQNGEFKALVQKVLPGFEHHLAETAEIAHKLGYK